MLVIGVMSMSIQSLSKEVGMGSKSHVLLWKDVIKQIISSYSEILGLGVVVVMLLSRLVQSAPSM